MGKNSKNYALKQRVPFELRQRRRQALPCLADLDLILNKSFFFCPILKNVQCFGDGKVTAMDFDQTIEKNHRRLVSSTKEDLSLLDVFSQRDDVSLFNPLGPTVRGRKRVSGRLCIVTRIQSSRIDHRSPHTEVDERWRKPNLSEFFDDCLGRRNLILGLDVLGDRNDKRRIMRSRRANRPESKLYNRLY